MTHPIPPLILAALLILTASVAWADDVGIASWYGPGFHGKTTANGETFDTNALTAAHKSLPFGTMVRVTHLLNGTSVVVRINDRGPFIPGRIIDLSKAAAREIDMISSGTARVRIQALSTDPAPAAGALTVQVGAYGLPANAERVRALLADQGYQVALRRSGGITRVRVTGVDPKTIDATLRTLSSLGFDSCMILRS